MPYDVVRKFEKTIAEYAGSRYAVSVSSCTAALFLACKYTKVRWVHIPSKTYPGVPASIIHAGGKVCFTHEAWTGIYQLRPYEIYDSAMRFCPNMYIRGSLYCLSFHAKKRIPIGEGGMILTDDIKAVSWLKQARFDGRHECPLMEDDIEIVGWHYMMQPEQASRGLRLFNLMREDSDLKDEYPNLSKMKAFRR